jgi:hypothetical protein
MFVNCSRANEQIPTVRTGASLLALLLFGRAAHVFLANQFREVGSSRIGEKDVGLAVHSNRNVNLRLDQTLHM